MLRGVRSRRTRRNAIEGGQTYEGSQEARVNTVEREREIGVKHHHHHKTTTTSLTGVGGMGGSDPWPPLSTLPSAKNSL